MAKGREKPPRIILKKEWSSSSEEKWREMEWSKA